VVNELFPHFGREYLLSKQDNNTSAFWKDTPTLNSLNASTNDWVQLLERLTLQQGLRFLTMLPWADVLSPKYLIRKTRAWCPLCFYEWDESGEVYEPLLWSLEIVTVCRNHKRDLETKCPSCKRSLYLLAPNARPGYCSCCKQWLGKMPSQKAEQLLTSDEYRWQYWVVDVVGEMLAVEFTMIASLQRERFAEAIKACLDTTDGNVSALSRKLRVSRRTINDWRRCLQIPQLDSLLQVCSILEISPFHVFASEAVNILTRVTSSMSGSPPNRRSRRYPRLIDLGRISSELEAELQKGVDKPSPMSIVARRLGFDQSFLYKYFPELCQAISSCYRAYRRKMREERRRKILEEVREVTIKVHASGVYPSQERVRLLLGKPGSIREPGALAVWHETLVALGPESGIL